MTTAWRSLMVWLVWLSSDPAAIDAEAPKAAAAVAAAMAAMAPADAGPPAPQPAADCDCGETCVDGKWKPDGRIVQDCECSCGRCVRERGGKVLP